MDTSNFSDPKQLDRFIIDSAADGADPELIAYRLRKLGFESANKDFVQERLIALSKEIELERRDRELRAKVTLESLIPKFMSHLQKLEQITKSALDKSKSRSAVEAIKEANQTMIRLFDMYQQIKHMSMKQSDQYIHIDKLKEFIKSHPELVFQSLDEKALASLGLVKVEKEVIS